jgi:hypothetical protein
MGETKLSPGEVKQLLECLARAWLGKDYDLLRCNCCHFSDELCKRLGVGTLPSWLTNMADVGATIWGPSTKEVSSKAPRGVPRSLDDPADVLWRHGMAPRFSTPGPRRRRRRSRARSEEPEEEPPKLNVDPAEELQKWHEILIMGLPAYMQEHPNRFHRRVRRGVPPELRWEIWKAAVEFSEQDVPHNYEEASCTEGQWSALISLDIGRTFADLPEFDTGRQEALSRILNAYANLTPSVGYCQGMNYVAGLLLMVSDNEREAFGMFAHLLDHDGLSGFYLENMPLLRTYVKACDRLIAETVPGLRDHLMRENVPLALYLHQWFLTLFIKSFPLATVVVIWDVIICTGLPVILPITVAILQVFEEGLLAMQFEDINMVFKAMRTYKDSEILAYRIGQILMKYTKNVELPAHIQEYLEQGALEHPNNEQASSDDEDEAAGDQVSQCSSYDLRVQPHHMGRQPPAGTSSSRTLGQRCRMSPDGSPGVGTPLPWVQREQSETLSMRAQLGD